MSRAARILLLVCLLTASGAGLPDRKRITLAPQEGEYSVADIEKEILFGRETAAILLADRKLVANDRLTRYVNLVGQSIVRHANRPELNFYFAVVDSSRINAYAVPGGYIFVTSAALELMENEAELAGVLAHEIAHVTERHIVSALRIRADDDSMTAVVSKLAGATAESANVIFYQAVEQALAILYEKGLAAADEYDADTQGLYLTAVAGYDAGAYLRYLERIGKVLGTGNAELTGTHPPISERADRLKTIITEQGLDQLGGTRNEKRFREISAAWR